MKRILVTGSRDWTDRDLVRRVLLEHGPGVMIHGAARGLDRIAAEVASDLGWPTEPHPARWRSVRGVCVNPEEGGLRNQRMIDRVIELRTRPVPVDGFLDDEVCLAFPLPNSKGTWDCTRRARFASIRVIVTKAVQ